MYYMSFSGYEHVCFSVFFRLFAATFFVLYDFFEFSVDTSVY